MRDIGDLRDWLACMATTYGSHVNVAIDDDAMRLVVVGHPGPYFELGALPVRQTLFAACRSCGARVSVDALRAHLTQHNPGQFTGEMAEEVVRAHFIPIDGEVEG